MGRHVWPYSEIHWEPSKLCKPPLLLPHVLSVLREAVQFPQGFASDDATNLQGAYRATGLLLQGRAGPYASDLRGDDAVLVVQRRNRAHHTCAHSHGKDESDTSHVRAAQDPARVPRV